MQAVDIWRVNYLSRWKDCPLSNVYVTYFQRFLISWSSSLFSRWVRLLRRIDATNNSQRRISCNCGYVITKAYSELEGRTLYRPFYYCFCLREKYERVLRWSPVGPVLKVSLWTLRLPFYFTTGNHKFGIWNLLH